MSKSTELDPGSMALRRTTRAVGAALLGVGALVLLLLTLLSGFGLLYGLRGLHWLAVGPRVGDALPLLQLAGYDGQPLARVAAAWLAAGLIFGLALIQVSSRRLVLTTSVVGVLLLLFASDAAYALADNLRLSHVLWVRAPAVGPWFEGLLFAVGSTLPRWIVRLQRSRSDALIDSEPARCLTDPA